VKVETAHMIADKESKKRDSKNHGGGRKRADFVVLKGLENREPRPDQLRFIPKHSGGTAGRKVFDCR